MWLMLQQDEPADYVIATGVTHSVGELAECAFARAGLDWKEYVRVDDSLLRGKAELHDLVGDASRARDDLGWSPSLDFEGLVHLLVDSDLERLESGRPLANTRPDP
jgi:GDPmannose 4,6-dehydratase